MTLGNSLLRTGCAPPLECSPGGQLAKERARAQDAETLAKTPYQATKDADDCGCQLSFFGTRGQGTKHGKLTLVSNEWRERHNDEQHDGDEPTSGPMPNAARHRLAEVDDRRVLCRDKGRNGNDDDRQGVPFWGTSALPWQHASLLVRSLTVQVSCKATAKRNTIVHILEIGSCPLVVLLEEDHYCGRLVGIRTWHLDGCWLFGRVRGGDRRVAARYWRRFLVRHYWYC